MKLLRSDLHGRLTLERCCARQHLEKDDTKRILVSASVDFAANDLLRGHIVRCSDWRSRASQSHLLSLIIRKQLDQTKVGQEQATIGRQQHIRGFDIAVDYSASVRKIQGRGHLFDVVQRFLEREWPL